jgi:hypothetical protein
VANSAHERPQSATSRRLATVAADAGLDEDQPSEIALVALLNSSVSDAKQKC